MSSPKNKLDVIVNGEEPNTRNIDTSIEKVGHETLDLTMGQTIEFKKGFGNADASNDQATGTLPNTTNQNFNDPKTQLLTTHGDVKDDGESMEPMSALPAVTSVQKIETIASQPELQSNEDNPKPQLRQPPNGPKLSMKQALGIVINKKHLHGGAHPDRMPLQVNTIIPDPNDQELDEMGNPLDYFSIYKQEMKKLAHSKFDEEQDHQFFSYLDRLVFAEKYKKEDRIDGLGILREFVTDHASLTYVKRRNEQIKRFQQARQARIERGEPADPPDQDNSMMKALLDELNAKQTKKVLRTKTFVPDIQKEDEVKQGNSKNYITKEKYGKMRNFRAPWQDPNPLKYGGQFGMQRMKEMVDTGYNRGKADDIRRQEAERQASMTLEQMHNEQENKIKMEMMADQSKAKLTDLNEEKRYDVIQTLEPQERSFLIQPEKSQKARLPSIFSANNMSPAETSAQNSPKNQSNSNFRVSKLNDDSNLNTNLGNLHPGSSNQSFVQNEQNQFGFGQRSQSMAAPNLGMPQSVRNIDMKGESFALQFQDQSSRITLNADVFGKTGDAALLQQDPSRQAIDNYKTMLQNQGSSKHLLNRIQSQYTEMRSIQEMNDERYLQNNDNLKYSIHQSNNKILNPPIKEGYDHIQFKRPTNVENTVKLSFALEELRKDPTKMKKLMGVSPGPKVKYTLRHGKNSIQSDSSKLSLFDNLTRDVLKIKNDRKKNQSQGIFPESLGNTKSAMDHHQSSNIKSNRNNSDPVGFWDKPLYVILIENGTSLKDKRTKSIRVNLTKFIKKYEIQPPKFIARLPDEFIKSQNVFFERAYMEILEYCNDHMDNRTKGEKELKQAPDFITMYTADGNKLETIRDIQDFISSRKLEILEGSKGQQYLNTNESSVLKLPEIKKPFQQSAQYLHIPQQSPSSITLDKKVNRQRKAQFISYSPSVASNQFEQSQLSQQLSEVELPPPLILVSTVNQFKGVAQSKEGYSTSQLRESNANEVKDRIDSQRGDWGNQQILSWIESNVESGRSEPYNMESVLQKDSRQSYPNTNVEYRQKVAKRLTGSSSTEKMKPVYIGGGLSSAKNFLLPIIEEGTLTKEKIDNQRRKFGGRIDLEQQEQQQLLMDQEKNSLNLKFNSGQTSLGQGYYGSQSHLQLNESPSQFSVATGGLGQGSPWDQDLVSKVEQLKKQFIQKQYIAQTDRNQRISPDKTNFAELSYQHSQASLARGGARFQSPSISSIQQSPISAVSGSLRKIVGSFNLQLDKDAVDKLRKGQGARSPGGVQPRVSKNIPHLQLDKKKNQKRDVLNYDQVESFANELKLPTNTIYQLRTEYECLKDMGEDESLTDIQILGGQTLDGQNGDNQPPSLLEGIQVPIFLKNFKPFKEAHMLVVEKIIGALGLQNSRASVIDWNCYLKIQSLFKFHTAVREVYVDFWLKFFNLYNQLEVESSEVIINLELLSRGCYTETSTMVSDAYAESVYEMLKESGCTADGTHGEVVDMIIFKKKLIEGAIDVERLNQCLKPSNDDGIGETDQTFNHTTKMTQHSHLGPFDDKSSIQRMNDNQEIFN